MSDISSNTLKQIRDLITVSRDSLETASRLMTGLVGKEALDIDFSTQ